MNKYIQISEDFVDEWKKDESRIEYTPVISRIYTYVILVPTSTCVSAYELDWYICVVHTNLPDFFRLGGFHLGCSSGSGRVL